MVKPTDDQLRVAAAALSSVPSQSGEPATYARVDLVDVSQPMVLEIELIDPSLMLRLAPRTATAFAQAIRDAVS
jgi:hypothetical protein